MNLTDPDYRAIRDAMAAISDDVSNDAVGSHAPTLEEIYAPETHAAALDPGTPIVLGARGTGKSFWAGVLGKKETRSAARTAYPKLGLDRVEVGFGFTGLGGPEGLGVDALKANVPEEAGVVAAKNFWWATVLNAAARAEPSSSIGLTDHLVNAGNWEERERILAKHEQRLRAEGKTLLIVYDALDTVATTWPRRRLLTETLLEVVWAMRAYRSIRLKLFLRPDQIEDDGLRFVELSKLRTGAVRLLWSGTDLYGLLYARLALRQAPDARAAFEKLLANEGLRIATQDEILARRWSLGQDRDQQKRVMDMLAGPFMAEGKFGNKKGKTYDWPLAHLGDAFNEVTPRSFLGLMIAAARHGAPPSGRAVVPDGIRHGLRAASKTRVDQLHQEFPWVKAVLAPLAGILLPQKEEEVFRAWERAGTVRALRDDAVSSGYLPPFPMDAPNGESQLYSALERIGVMLRRKDGRVDMPDLFRVAAKLLKKGATAPL